MNKISNREKKGLIKNILSLTDWVIQIPIDDKEEYSKFVEILIEEIVNNALRHYFEMLDNQHKLTCQLSGMALSARNELLNSFKNMDDDVIVIDPEAEYLDWQV